ncbi:MAG: 2-amino-4-hydroxy-6-hydroxymethyldihydropteridine diphosphokinase [Methyloceanibacter sp.]|nr:2-amino-4-hydroxy-6-hydroxymethyldihydropteridine diphosphokinase [Methyloceanibacter sp.]
MSQILVGLGANFPGPWGDPATTIGRALANLNQDGVALVAVSDLYETAAVGRAGQPNYVNAVARIDTAMPPESLLRRLKQIERAAGRRGGSPWGPRSLDIDILDFRGRVQNWRGRVPRFAPAGRRPLVLPHPWIEKRPFVLRPLLDIDPDWRHPVTRESGEALWRRVAQGWEGQVLRTLVPDTRLASDA